MFNSHLPKRIITIVMTISLFTGVYSQCMLQHIAKTHSIVRDKYKHLSIANGAIGWETGTIRRLYDFGEIYPEYRVDKRSNRKFIAKYNNPEKTSQLVRLIHTLFYRIPGSYDTACFGPTNHMLDTNPFVAVQTIAKIFAICEQIQAEELPPIKALHAPNIQNHFNALLKPQARLDADMGTVVLNALHESYPLNEKQMYPLHMLQMVLLTFVYKKYSNDRNLLASFYGELNNNLDKQLLIPDINYNAWVKEIFKPVDQATAFEKVETIVFDKDGTLSIQKNLDEFVYYANQIRSFPTPIGYQTANYKYMPHKQALSFPDCMETALRNFMMMCAYDSRTNQCNVKKLQETLGIDTVHSTLVQFLETFGDMASKQAHDAWTNVISNLPFVAYHRMIDDTNGKSSVRMKDKGYVTIPETMQNDNLRNWLAQHEYQVCTAQQYGYELRPSRKNIIILLNHLLQLNLFKNTEELAQEFMRPDFVAEYFPRLCIAINAKGYLSDQGTQAKDIDAIDCTSTILYTILYLPDLACEFRTSAGHGEFGFLKQNNLQEDKSAALKELLQKFDTPGYSNIDLVVTDLLWRGGIDYRLKISSEYSNFFAMPLENTGLLKNALHAFSEMPFNISLSTKINVKNLLLRMAERQPDDAQRDIIRLKILTKFVKKLSPSDQTNENIGLAEMIPYMVDGIISWSREKNTEALRLFDILIEYDEAFAEEILVDGMYGDDAHALSLFKVFVKRNQAIPEAIQAALKSIGYSDEYARRMALILFRVLVEHDQAFAQATQAALHVMMDMDTIYETLSTKEEALSLFKMLVDRDQAFAEATQAAVKGVSSEFSSERVKALDLFKLLMIKDPIATKNMIRKILADSTIKLNSYMEDILSDLVKEPLSVRIKDNLISTLKKLIS